MTRVLYITADEERETFLRTEVAALRSLGAEVRVVSLRRLMRDRHAYWTPAASVRSVGRLLGELDRRTDRLRLRAWPKTGLAACLAAAVVREAQDWRPQHVHGFWASGPASSAWLVADALNVPFSFSAHRSDVYAGELLCLKLRHAAFVRAISHRSRALLTAAPGAAGVRVEVVRVGVEVPPPTRRPIAGERFLAVGNLLPVKGHVHALRAVEIAAAWGVELGLDIVGSGPLHQLLRERIDESDVLRGRVRLLGRRPHDDVLAALPRYAGLVHPSVMRPGGVEEGVPVVILEAGARRLPVVATLSGATGELVDETVAWPVAPGDPAALAAAMATVRDASPAARQRADALYQRIQQSWDVRRTAACLAELFGRCS